jgi:hypothetical protein
VRGGQEHVGVRQPGEPGRVTDDDLPVGVAEGPDQRADRRAVDQQDRAAAVRAPRVVDRAAGPRQGAHVRLERALARPAVPGLGERRAGHDDRDVPPLAELGGGAVGARVAHDGVDRPTRPERRHVEQAPLVLGEAQRRDTGARGLVEVRVAGRERDPVPTLAELLREPQRRVQVPPVGPAEEEQVHDHKRRFTRSGRSGGAVEPVARLALVRHDVIRHDVVGRTRIR